MWFWRRQRIPSPDAAGEGRQRSCAELILYLEQVLAPREPSPALTGRLQSFRSLPPARQQQALPAVYLLFEQEIVDATGGGRTRTELQKQVVQHFAELVAIPSFGLIFEPPLRQELLLCRRLLVSTAERATAVLGATGNDMLGALAAWLDAVPESFPPIPLGIAHGRPRTDSEWVALFFRLARELFGYLEGKLGERLPRSFYEAGYNAVASQYAMLETFPVVVHLLPEKLLDSEKIGQLSRSQIQKVLLDKITELNDINGQLRVQNDEVEAARRDVVKARDLLEERVAERTRELTAANEQLKREIAVREIAERDLRAAKEAADSANRAKSEFLANMSHELRTPLNAIIGFSEILKSAMGGQLSPERRASYAADIHSSGEHLLGIINDILDMARVDAGVTEFRESDVDLARVVQSTMRLLQPHAEAGRIALRAAVADGFPALYADERLLKQILLNLLSNAVKFTPAGGSVAIAAIVESGAVVLAVRDTGIGIPADQLARVMQPFGQVESALSRQHGGTGLGLPLAKSFAELHGGSINLDSESGRGTTVTVRFPAERTRLPRLSARPLESATRREGAVA